jgi:hypothetical protein
MKWINGWAAVAAVGLMAWVSTASASPYSVQYLDGGNWNTVFTQGFNSSLGATPNPGLSNGAPVYLKKFEFFKSGTADTAANVQLAIVNNIFLNMGGSGTFTTGNAAFVGLSNNTLANTAGIATGDPVPFMFSNLPLSYGSDYAAIAVTVSGNTLTPVKVSALTANYTDVGGGDFHPTTNYGTESQFIYATSNFIQAGFFNTFSYAGDANFRATIDTVPEPASLTFFAGAAVVLAAGMFRRRRAR